MKNLLHISGKCSDLFSASVVLHNGKQYEYEGYPIDCVNGGNPDYIDLTIDLSTGRIVNWDPPDVDDIKRTFKKLED